MTYSPLYIAEMSEGEPPIEKQRRQLLPRWPSDRVIVALMIGGLVTALIARVDLWYGFGPGGLAISIQHVAGHVSAWRRGGVERAFVMESSAISFYVVVVLLAAAAVLGAADVVEIGVHWMLLGALFVDTIVRGIRESRYA